LGHESARNSITSVSELQLCSHTSETASAAFAFGAASWPPKRFWQIKFATALQLLVFAARTDAMNSKYISSVQSTHHDARGGSKESAKKRDKCSRRAESSGSLFGNSLVR
jgi:hypothetical protein